jgi:hypothetical protein
MKEPLLFCRKGEKMTKLEQALLAAAKSFITAYMGLELTDEGEGMGQPKKAAPIQTSNGIPVCPSHGKAMRPSKFGNGYYCGAKLQDGSYCKQKA